MYYQNVTKFCAIAETQNTTVTTLLLLDTNMLPSEKPNETR